VVRAPWCHRKAKSFHENGGLLLRLEVTNACKDYPTPNGPLTVLTEINLSLGPGDAAAIMGPSGTGKSTLLYILGALETPSRGTVTLGDKNSALSFRIIACCLSALSSRMFCCRHSFYHRISTKHVRESSSSRLAFQTESIIGLRNSPAERSSGSLLRAL